MLIENKAVTLCAEVFVSERNGLQSYFRLAMADVLLG